MVEPAKEKQSSILLIFIFTLLCGASEAFMKAFKVFLWKPFEIPQRSAKIKFKLIFVLTELSEMQRAGKVKNNLKQRRNDFSSPNSFKFYFATLRECFCSML